MKSFLIAWKDFKIMLQDRKGFMLMISMPVLLTAILGAALSGVMEGEAGIPKTTIGVYQADSDALGNTFIDEVLQGAELKNALTVKKLHSEAEVEQAINDKAIDVGLIIPEKWSEDLQKGALKKLQLYVDPGKQLQGDVVKSIVSSFNERVLAISVATSVVITDLSTAVPVTNGAVNIDQAVNELTEKLHALSDSNMNAVTDDSIGDKKVTSMQYYAAAMGAMFLLFNIMFGAKSIINERNTDTLARLMSTPSNNTLILTGKFLGTFYFAVVQFLVFLTATHFLFKVNWGSNLLQTIAIGVVYAFAVSGLSMLIAGIIKNEKSADMVGGIGIQILGLLGGSMIPLTIFPETLKKIANLAPNKWALSSFIEIMGGTTWNALIMPIIVLVVIGVLSLTIGTIRLRIR